MQADNPREVSGHPYAEGGRLMPRRLGIGRGAAWGWCGLWLGRRLSRR